MRMVPSSRKPTSCRESSSSRLGRSTPLLCRMPGLLAQNGTARGFMGRLTRCSPTVDGERLSPSHGQIHSTTRELCCCISSCLDVTSQRDPLTRSCPSTTVSSLSSQNTDPVSILLSPSNHLTHLCLFSLVMFQPPILSHTWSARHKTAPFFSPHAMGGFLILFQRRTLPPLNL